MSNYFDNQSNWHWTVSSNRVTVTTDHGDHTHTLDLTSTPIGELSTHIGKVMGEAHRAASHDFKDQTSRKGSISMSNRQSFLERIRCDQTTIAKTNQVSKESAQKSAQPRRTDDGGRERGEEGPARLGREPGNKVGAIRASLKTPSTANASQATGAAISSGRGAASPVGGHGTGGQGGAGKGGGTGAGHGGGSAGGGGGHGGHGAGGKGGGHGGH